MAKGAAAGVTLAIVTALALAGCVPTPAPVPTKTAVETAAPTASPTPTAPPVPVLVESGTAEQNQPYFDSVAFAYFGANGLGSSQGIIDTLATAGFRKQDMEVTEDRTSIDLAADSIVFSVRLKGECLIGSFQPAGYKSLIAPLLGTGGCLIGTTVQFS